MDTPIVPERTCSRCGETKTLISRNFARDRGGFTRNCRECKGKRPTFAERFWSKVKRVAPDVCWEWQAGCAKSGYGELQRGRRGEGMTTAHRAAYELTHGPIPDGLVVMHACDNRKCCNPQHLSLGTLADNNRDMWSKGRGFAMPQVVGERVAASKLTAEKVREIRSRLASGATLRALAREFLVSESALSAIRLRRTWKHIE